MSSITGLKPIYTDMIDQIMALERRPLQRLEDQRDSISVQSGVYQDLRTNLDALQDAAQKLISTDPFYALTPGRSGTVETTASEDTILTASVGGDAGVGEYEISVTNLAEAERDASTAQSSIDQALGLSGTFWLGGTGTASSSLSANATVTGSGTAAVTDGLQELGTMTYTVETRDNNGTLEFRLKDVDGTVVSIADQDGEAGSTTTSWQAVQTGTFDTGRGLTIDLDASGSAGSTAVDYTAAGTSITVESTDTLLGIADKINDADQPAGRAASATIVGTQLILSAEQTGTEHTMIYSDGVGLGFTDLQAAEDAAFTVNDIAFTRSSNTVSDVIHDVTFDLAEDAEGKTASLQVSSDLTGAQSAIEGFLSEFNKVTSYIESKSAVTKVSEEEYSRGPLAGETVFSNLRGDLLSDFMSSFANDGSLDSLREIGLTVSDSLEVTISDQDLLQEALQDNFSDVGALLDSVIGEIDNQLSRFTGSGGYMTSAIENLDSHLSELSSDINDYEDRLEDRELYLFNKYAEMQSQLTSLQLSSQMWSSINSSMNRYI